MSDTTSGLDSHFARFVEQQVATGRYDSADDVLRAGLRLLEQQEAQLAALRAALIDGEESGDAEPFDLERFLADKNAQQE